MIVRKEWIEDVLCYDCSSMQATQGLIRFHLSVGNDVMAPITGR